MRRVNQIVIFLALLLVACGGGITPRQVYDQLERAGLATNARAAPPAAGLIGRCGERLEFDIPSGGSGMIVVCSPPVTIEAAGAAALYRSAGGRVNVLVSGAPAIAPRIGEEVEHIQD